MALLSSHVNSLEGTQPGTTRPGRYPTRRLYDGTEHTKGRGGAALSRQQKETMRWKGEDQSHQTDQAPPTKKGSNKHTTCTNKNDKGRIAWNRRSKP